MRIALKKSASPLLIVLLFISCSDKVINEEPEKSNLETGKNIDLTISVPRNSISTYSSEAGTADENHIDTLFVNILENSVLKAAKKFYGASLQTVGNSNDSIVKVAFEIDNLTGGTVTADVFANRTEITPITAEMPLPDKNDRLTWFMMSGSGTLNYAGTAYHGTINVVRNVAKLRVRITKHPTCIPANLVINYANIKIETLQAPDRTQLMTPPPISTPTGLSYIANYTSHTGNSLRPETPFASFNGGQIDSLYLNENFLNDADYNSSNITKVKVTLPTQEPGMPVKTAEFTYPLFTEGSYRIKRNFIYILDIKIAGQSLEPLISLDIAPWNDVEVTGNINGTFLNLDKSVVNLTPASTQNDPQTVIFNTDQSSVALDWKKVDPTHKIDTSVVHIQGSNGKINFFWNGNGNGAPDYNFKDTVYVVAGNIVKAIELVYNTPSGTFGNWVGTFHRWNQTGERLIKMRNTGKWTATVIQGASFIVLDTRETADANWGGSYAALGNDPGFDSNYPVNSTATSVSGNGIVSFRVGINSALANAGAAPRYGLIQVVTDQWSKIIYVRQGEEADYVMRPVDPNPGNANNTRPYAVRFAPFNLADPQRGTGGSRASDNKHITYADAGFNSLKFTDYPSQAGYFFQWSLGSTYAFNPVNAISAITNWPLPTLSGWRRDKEPCPAGYRHPNDSVQSPVTSEIRQSWYAVPNSETYSTQPANANLDNSVWGFYADGFFDRLAVVSSPNGTDATTVSYVNPINSPANTAVAYAGRLIYNPVTYASLFLPAPGRRAAADGALANSGAFATYWTSTYTGSNYGWAFCFTPNVFYSSSRESQAYGASVRCVKSEFRLPGSL